MALPVVPALLIAGRSLGMALRRWQGIVAFAGLFIAVGFTFSAMLRQMGETALRLWPILAIACLFLLLKEVIKAWFMIKQNERNPRSEK